MTDILRQVTQGDTGTLYKVGVTGDPVLSDAPVYTCSLSVPSAVPPISRAVVTLLDADTRFAVQLTTAETALLAPNVRHTMAIEVLNASLVPEFKVETFVEFYVKKQVI